jgi:AmmeMemoRadiSam system protein A
VTGGLTPQERELLLKVARSAIGDALEDRSDLAPLLDEARARPALIARRGAFVTLKTPDEGGAGGYRLRGCIGNAGATHPLYRTVAEVAPRAAFRDPRFEPVTAEELPTLRFEISALTTMEALPSLDDVVLGRDGVQLTHGEFRSLFLPQVAVEQNWTATRLVEELSIKAGLSRDGWQRATLETFQAEVFADGPH